MTASRWFSKCFRLCHIARKAIQNKSAQRIRLSKASLHPIKNVVIRHKVPGGNRRLDFAPELCPARDMVPDDLPGRNMRHAEESRQCLALRSLSRTRRAEQNKAHQRIKPS